MFFWTNFLTFLPVKYLFILNKFLHLHFKNSSRERTCLTFLEQHNELFIHSPPPPLLYNITTFLRTGTSQLNLNQNHKVSDFHKPILWTRKEAMKKCKLFAIKVMGNISRVTNPLSPPHHPHLHVMSFKIPNLFCHLLCYI